MINHVKHKEEIVLVKTFFQHVKEASEFIANTILQV